MPKDLDPHKNEVYTWEDSCPGWNRNHITLKACREVIYAACDHYKVKRPIVVQHPRRSFSWSMPRHNRMSIQGGEHREKGGRNVATALHEAAHHIAWSIHGERIQDHGATWLAIYLDLLSRAGVAPRVALEASAKAHKLRWRKEKSALR